MSLENLVGISLETIEPDSAAITRLLAAAERNIADSHFVHNATETRRPSEPPMESFSSHPDWRRQIQDPSQSKEMIRFCIKNKT